MNDALTTRAVIEAANTPVDPYRAAGNRSPRKQTEIPGLSAANRAARRLQRLVAGIVVLVPLAGLVVALAEAYVRGIRPWNWVCWPACTSSAFWVRPWEIIDTSRTVRSRLLRRCVMPWRSWARWRLRGRCYSGWLSIAGIINTATSQAIRTRPTFTAKAGAACLMGCGMPTSAGCFRPN